MVWRELMMPVNAIGGPPAWTYARCAHATVERQRGAGVGGGEEGGGEQGDVGRGSGGGSGSSGGGGGHAEGGDAGLLLFGGFASSDIDGTRNIY